MLLLWLREISAVHMIECAEQHTRRHNAVHTGQQHCLHRDLTRIGSNVHEVCDPLCTVNTVPDSQQLSSQAETAVVRGSMALCDEQTLAKQGILLDSRFTAATTASNRKHSVAPGFTRPRADGGFGEADNRNHL